MVKMEILLYNAKDPDGDPLEISVDGNSIEELKICMNDAIMKAVESHDKQSGYYDVEVIFTENGEYLDGDQMGMCFCDLHAGRAKFEELEEADNG